VSVNRLAYKLPKELSAAVAASLDEWKNNNKVARLADDHRTATCESCGPETTGS
jgi:hypothetical protein